MVGSVLAKGGGKIYYLLKIKIMNVHVFSLSEKHIIAETLHKIVAIYLPIGRG